MLITSSLRSAEMKNSHGIPMTEEELSEWKQAFIDIEESIELVMKNGEEL